MNKPSWPIWSPLKPLRSSYPDTSLLGGMPYRNSSSTSVAETFRRERERLERERRQREQREAHERD